MNFWLWGLIKRPTFDRWDLVCMVIFLAIVIAFEMMGVFCSRFVTITALTRAYIPKFIRWAFCLWLTWHFCLEK